LVRASADGYARTSKAARAPGTVALLLTPESSLSGTVVDGTTGAPVEGADITVEQNTWYDQDGHADRTDAQGVFRVTQLPPARYMITARTDHGYGHSEGSTLVGLGQHVDGVVVKLFPAVK